jgi:hypothetical protein
MADYRDPKVTTTGTKRDSGTSKWIGIAVAVLVVLLLIAWWTGAFNGEVEPEAVAPATEAPVTETPATETPATEPTAPAQQ